MDYLLRDDALELVEVDDLVDWERLLTSFALASFDSRICRLVLSSDDGEVTEVRPSSRDCAHIATLML